MCWSCDRPGSTKGDFLEHMAGLVQTYGWAINFVEPGRIHPPWAYTIGLTFRGLPELVMTGLSQDVVGPLMNAEASRILVDGLPAAGEQFVLSDGREAEVVELPHPRAHLETVSQLFGDYPYTAVQLVWADESGRWPWEPGFAGPSGAEPVLGPRAG